MTHARRDHEVAREFLAELRGHEPDADEVALLDEAVDACCDDPDVDVLVGEPAGVSAPRPEGAR
jgi:exonuclease SbcD